MRSHLRIARPVSDLARSVAMYGQALELAVLASFENHEGFDGVMLGRQGMDYHFEFTCCRAHPIVPAPTVEDLIVFYLPGEQAWRSACAAMLAAGFRSVKSSNPYWDLRGCSFEDPDRYRVVLQNAPWSNEEGA